MNKNHRLEMNRFYKRYLITGGLGFIGTNFIYELLKNKDSLVFNLDNMSTGCNLSNGNEFKKYQNYKFFSKSICSKGILDILKENRIDCIVHFAAESHVDRSIEDPSNFIDTNINGTYNLLEQSLQYMEINNDFHFHHISTDEVYGSLTLQDEPFSESSQFRPNSPYSASKASSDHLVRAWNQTYGLNTTISNCSNNYGPYQNYEKFIPHVLKQALSGKPITIYGDGKNIRDWLYVSDHCSAILKILSEGSFGQTYNIGGNNQISNIEIVNIVCKILEELALRNKKFNNQNFTDLIEYIEDRKGHDFRYDIDSKKIESELSWTPKVEFETGIKSTISWYLENIEYLK